METTVLLKLDNLSNRLVLNRLQLRSISLASGNSITLLNKLIGTEQRANVLSSERGASLSGRHFCAVYVYFKETRERERGKLFAAWGPCPAAI